MFTVLKPFPHPTRRFAVGDTVTEADLAGCVIDLADLKKRRFIAGADTKAAEVAAEKSAPGVTAPKSRSAFG
jgi:hypothetical protein